MNDLREQLEAKSEMYRLNNPDQEENKKMKEEIEKRRKAALEDGGLSVDEIREEFKLSEDCPYIVNISDDPSLAGCLIHYLKDPQNKIGSKAKVGIKINGLGIHEEHCTISVQDDEVVKVTSIGNNRTLVNGSLLVGSKQLNHSDRLVFGHGNAWKVMIPKLKDEIQEEDHLSYGDVMVDRLNSDTPEARNMKKYLSECEQRIGAEKTKKFVMIFAEILDLIDEANMYSEARYEHNPIPANKVYFTLEVMVDIMDYQEDDPEFAIRMRNKDTDEVIHLWDYEKFVERVEMMAEYYSDLKDDGELNHEYPFDPWLDVVEDAVSK